LASTDIRVSCYDCRLKERSALGLFEGFEEFPGSNNLDAHIFFYCSKSLTFLPCHISKCRRIGRVGVNNFSNLTGIKYGERARGCIKTIFGLRNAFFYKKEREKG